jgi:hypothetical protein
LSVKRLDSASITHAPYYCAIVRMNALWRIVVQEEITASSIEKPSAQYSLSSSSSSNIPSVLPFLSFHTTHELGRMVCKSPAKGEQLESTYETRLKTGNLTPPRIKPDVFAALPRKHRTYAQPTQRNKLEMTFSPPCTARLTQLPLNTVFSTMLIRSAIAPSTAGAFPCNTPGSHIR